MHQVGAVSFHRLGAYFERHSNFLVTPTLCYQLDNLAFAWGERGLGSRVPRVFLGMYQGLRRRRWTTETVWREQGMDGRDQIPARVGLQGVPAHCCFSAARINCSEPCMVRIKTSVRGTSLMICRAASVPFNSGIL